MRRKPGIDPRTLLLGCAVGLLELAIIALWIVDDPTVAAWLGR